jgi:hypothetical protein
VGLAEGLDGAWARMFQGAESQAIKFKPENWA